MIYQRKKQESIRELWRKKIKSEQSSLKSHVLRRTLCNFLFLYMFLLPCSNSSTNTQYPDGVRHLPKGDFPSGKLPKVRLGFWGTTGCNEGRVLWLGWARGPSAAARTCSGSSVAVWTDLGSCRLENAFGKVPNIYPNKRANIPSSCIFRLQTYYWINSPKYRALTI